MAARRRRLWSAAISAAAVVLLAALPAHGDEPLSLDGEITDRVGAVEGRTDEVQAAIDRLYDDHRLQLFVVYVDDFSDWSAAEWADETALQNGLGVNDALLAVATSERVYALSVDPQYPLTDAELDEITTVAVEPALRENDWAGAAIGAADGLDAVRSGEQIQAPDITPGDAEPTKSGSATPWIIGGVAVAGVGAAGWAVARGFRKRRGGASIPVDQLPLDELEKRAGVLLVETDDAIKTSEQEVGFAEAQYGAEAAAPFAAAVAEAQAHLTESFKIRQQLDDSTPEDEPTRRKLLGEIIERLDAANDRLEAEADAFDRLRDLEKNAPEVLATVEQNAAALGTRVDQARAGLQALAARYVDAALEPVAGNADEAASRLDFARAAGATAHEKIQAGSMSEAAVQVRAAELAVGQAGELLDAVDRLGSELDKAAEGVRAGVADVEQDLAEATALAADPARSGGASADLTGKIAAAEAVVATVKQGLAGQRFDPLAALRRLQEAGGELDSALGGVRDAQAQAQRARASLDQAVLSARSQIAAVTDFITTRRGAVGGEARTRLVQAQRYLDQALAAAQSDPATALSYAQQADALAQQAGQLSQADVGGFQPQTSGYGGAFGGGGGGGMTGAILGGILGSMLGGGGGGRSYGGAPSWGGGTSRPRSSGSRSRGSSRGRRGTSGRF